MIAKTKIGRSFKGICNYLLAKVNEGKGIILETNGVREDNRQMIADFNMSKQHNDRLSRCVWHTSLSFVKEDQLTDDSMTRITKDWMNEMGLTNTSYVIIKHTDTDHPHVHLVASRIDNNGKTITDSNNWPRSEMSCRMLEEKYQLQRIPDIRRETKINQEALKGRDKFKSECHLALQEALRNTKNIEEFNKHMNNKKIECLWKFNPDGSPRGLSFQNNNLKIKASDINRMYSAKSITKYLEHNQARNEKKASHQSRHARHTLKKTAYQFTKATGSQDSIDDDIIRIDKVLKLGGDFKNSPGYGR